MIKKNYYLLLKKKEVRKNKMRERERLLGFFIQIKLYINLDNSFIECFTLILESIFRIKTC